MRRVVSLCSFLIVFLLGTMVFGQVNLQTRHWGNEPEDFDGMNGAIASEKPFNLLMDPSTKMVVAEGLTPDSVPLLCDGQAGKLGGEGRVFIGGTPSRLVFYLGAPRTISSIRLFSANIDTRANQDFEIRLVNNAKQPGVLPVFPDKPTYTSGDRIRGGNRGAVSTYVESNGKAPISNETYDWIEFRIWPTLDAWGETFGKEKSNQKGASTYVELQVLAEIKSYPGLFSSEEAKKVWFEKKLRQVTLDRVRELGGDAKYAFEHPEALKRAIDDLTEKYPDEFKSKNYLTRWEEFAKRIEAAKLDPEAAYAVAKEYEPFRREVLLANPQLDFENVLVCRTKGDGLEQNWISNASRRKTIYNAQLATFSIKDLDAPLKEVVRAPRDSFIGDIALHWSGEKCLVTTLSDNDTWQIFECNLKDGALKQVTPNMGGDVNNVEGCYVPDGSTIFISSASMMGVPCISGSDVVGNIYRLEADGKTIRQLTFEQDQDWCPVILENGRILYLRWEYIDIPHYFSRILMTMNPDGTNQVEHYGSGSYWPNSMFYAKPLPGQSSKFIAIVSGHHGIKRSGELVLFDPMKGRKEADGVVQRLPEFGKSVEPVIADQLVKNSSPQFVFPSPISEDLFLVSARFNPGEKWGVYLVDTLGNMLKIKNDAGFALLEPTPLTEKDEPQRIPDRTIAGAKESNVFITDLNFGQGLPNVPRGKVKKLRVYALSYSYRGLGGHDLFGMESCWDARRLLGEAPVFEDGSTTFKIPSNTPLVLQPLDENGAAMQLMRSWFVGMPGENVSCIGCHEDQNSVSPVKMTMAQKAQPKKLNEFYGPERPFSYEGEVQPVLDKYCVGCHNGEKPMRPNFADTTPAERNFSKSYHALQRFVRRPGPESDIHVLQPMEYHVSTSELIQMLWKGHYNVKLDKEAWQKLYSWIDLNVPYFGTWMDISKSFAPTQKMPGNVKKAEVLTKISDRYVELKKMYAGTELNFEAETFEKSNVQRPEFIAPAETPDPDFSSPKPDWGIKAKQTAAAQKESPREIALNDKVKMTLVKIPAGEFVMGDECGFNDELPRPIVAIEKPFWMMTTEVTNQMFALYDAQHDSRYIDQWNKDHTRPGYPANEPNQPVIRISWQQAVGFCKWLSQKTGKNFRLPTEAEWEWAARAGSDSPMWFGDLDVDFGKYENLSDESARLFVVQGIDPQPYKHQEWEALVPRANGINDGNMTVCAVGSYKANPWGLFDMLGNVAEWTQSDYKSYPYVDSDGRNAGTLELKKVARGGSWRDRPRWARAGLRRPYETWQKVFNVGFRVVCDD